MNEQIDSFEVEMLTEEAAEIRFSKTHPERVRIASELAASLLAAYPEVLARLDLDGMEKRSSAARELANDDFVWKPIERVLDGADRAFVRFPDDGTTYDRWRLLPASALDGKKDVDPSGEIDSLSECAINYLQANWASSLSLEQWLARRMIFAETFSLSREIGIPLHPKSVRVWWTWAKAVVKWLIGVAVAVAIGEAHGWPLGILAYVVWVALMQFLFQPRLQVLEKQTEVFARMRNCYVLASRQHPCPAELEDALRSAESKGAVWPEGLRALVERAQTRSAHTWSVPRHTFYKARASEPTAL